MMWKKKSFRLLFLFLLDFWPCLEAMLSMIHVCDTFMEPWKPMKSRRSAGGCLLCQQPWQCVLFHVMIPCSSIQFLWENSTTCGFWQEPHIEKTHQVQWGLGTLSEVTCRNQAKGQTCSIGTSFPNLVVQPRYTKFICKLLRYQNFWNYLCPDTGEINYSCIELPSLISQIYHWGIFYGIWLM